MLASSKYGGINVPPQLDMVFEAVTASSHWTILLTVLAMCVVYDQSTLLILPILLGIAFPWKAIVSCGWPKKDLLTGIFSLHSELHHEQRLNCWASVEDALHWPVLAIHEPQVRGVLCQMGQRSSQLRLGLP